MKMHMAIFAYSLGNANSLIEQSDVKSQLLLHGVTQSEIDEFKEMSNRIVDAFHRPAVHTEMPLGQPLLTEILTDESKD